MRGRVTVRGLMVAVAVAGVVMWDVAMRRRSAGLRRLATAHRSMSKLPEQARAEHHLALWAKYDRAARTPWLPVEPDPPEPR